MDLKCTGKANTGKNYKCSGATRAIACFDMITQLPILVSILLCTPIAIYHRRFSEYVEEFGGTPWAFILGILVLTIGVWLSHLLLTATHHGVDPKVALKKIKIYRSVHIALFTLYVCASLRNIIALVITVIVRGGFIIVVWGLIEELKHTIDGERVSVPSV